MKKKYLATIVIIAILAYVAYNYIYQDHRDIETETVAYTIKSNDLVNEFAQNQTAAETKYLNQTLVVTGDISEINTSDLTLNDAIFCSFDIEKKITNLTTKTNISVKGRCIGYDELLEQVKLDQCSILD